MWSTTKNNINSNTTKHKIKKDNFYLSFQEVIELWQNSNEFIEYFTQILRDSPYEAYFWEVKSITKATLNKDFEFVLVNSSILPRLNVNKSAFQSYFTKDKTVISFPNLRGDAQLIVPCDYSADNNYCHLANFIRNAPKEQINLFWKIVGAEYAQKIGEKPKWLSTAGLGVYWLHVRIDSRPKYYRYDGYK